MPRRALKQKARKPERKPEHHLSRARPPDLRRMMDARNLSSQGLSRDQMREMLRQADQTVQPRSLHGLTTMRKADLARVAATRGIDVTGLNAAQTRLKLQGWEPPQSSGTFAESYRLCTECHRRMFVDENEKPVSATGRGAGGPGCSDDLSSSASGALSVCLFASGSFGSE